MRNIKSNDLLNMIYYQVPKWLMDLFIDKKISQGAFKTYVLMYDRLKLSAGNKWIDKNGDVYIKYSYDEMTADLNCSRQAVSNNLQDLEKLDLIDKKKNFSSSSTFYLKIYSVENDSSLENLTSKENLDCHSSRKLDCSSLENLDANNNNFNKNNYSNNKEKKNDDYRRHSQNENIQTKEVEQAWKECGLAEYKYTPIENINIAIKDYGLSEIIKAIQRISRSSLMKTKTNIDSFFNRHNNFEQIRKTLNGTYDDREKKTETITATGNINMRYFQ
ncbi:MAG: replication initiator protein A [Leptotrichiaceae bacterium]|nr:replication initiator protein A [Leptotrichiaceae bacterium]